MFRLATVAACALVSAAALTGSVSVGDATTVEPLTTVGAFDRAYAGLFTAVDGGYSTVTPHGTAWTHGDNIRSADGRFSSNAVVVQRGARLRAYEQIVPDLGADFWWLGPSTWAGDRLWVLAAHGRRQPGGGDGWVNAGTDIVRFRFASDHRPVLDGILRSPWSEITDIGWTAAVVEVDDIVYVYGARPGFAGCQEVFVAAALRGGLVDPSVWSYWAGPESRWVDDPARAVSVHGDGNCWAPGFTVHADDSGRFAAVTKEGAFGENVVELTATSPVGLWEKRTLMTVPAGAYLALAHPEQQLTSGRLLVSYSQPGGSLRFAEVPR